VIGYGEQRPLKANDSAEGRNANRRVVIVILSTELMRQADPASVSPPDSPGAEPRATPPAPLQATPVPDTQPVAPQTALNDIQHDTGLHNTGTEPAP
jgi:chemotaxis protein MotB